MRAAVPCLLRMTWWGAEHARICLHPSSVGFADTFPRGGRQEFGGAAYFLLVILRSKATKDLLLNVECKM